MIMNLIRTIIGSVMILLWLPTSFGLEMYNIHNTEERKKLAKKLADIEVTKTALGTTLRSEGAGIPADIIPKNFASHLEGNHYAEYSIKSIDNTKRYTSLKMYDTLDGNPVMTPANYKHLAKQYGKLEVWDSVIENQRHIMVVYKLSQEQLKDIVTVKGLLDIDETEINNKFNIPVYAYEIGDVNAVRKIIFSRKPVSQWSWPTRIILFMFLFPAVLLLVGPFISAYPGLITGPLATMHSMLALNVSVFATALMYLITNYPLIVMGVAVSWVISYFTGLDVRIFQ